MYTKTFKQFIYEKGLTEAVKKLSFVSKAKISAQYNKKMKSVIVIGLTI